MLGELYLNIICFKGKCNTCYYVAVG